MELSTFKFYRHRRSAGGATIIKPCLVNLKKVDQFLDVEIWQFRGSRDVVRKVIPAWVRKPADTAGNVSFPYAFSTNHNLQFVVSRAGLFSGTRTLSEKLSSLFPDEVSDGHFCAHLCGCFGSAALARRCSSGKRTPALRSPLPTSQRYVHRFLHFYCRCESSTMEWTRPRHWDHPRGGRIEQECLLLMVAAPSPRSDAAPNHTCGAPARIAGRPSIPCWVKARLKSRQRRRKARLKLSPTIRAHLSLSMAGHLPGDSLSW